MNEKEEIVNVTVEPGGEVIEVPKGVNLLQALGEEGYFVPSPCGGMGNCGKCWVVIEEGAPPPSGQGEALFSREELQEGVRLSCQVQVNSPMKVELPGGGQPVESKALLEDTIGEIEPKSGISSVELQLDEPGKEDQRSDISRVVDALGFEPKFQLEAVRELPDLLRESDFRPTLVLAEEEIIEVKDETGGPLYGMAFDIGTTTVAGYGLDLETGRELFVSSVENPQSRFGADVVSRIKYVRENEDGLAELSRVVREAIGELVDKFCAERGAEKENVYLGTVVGNPTMLHLLTEVDPTNMDQSPYIPTLSSPMTFQAEELGVGINPRGKIYIAPSLSGYVGADVAAGVLYTEMYKDSSLDLLVDIGTNGEMVIGDGQRLVAASTAAGPAFEGANIEQGMTAREGAISHVFLENGKLEIEVIEGRRPLGLCGSGLVDAVGELRAEGLIAANGTFVKSENAPLRDKLIEIEDHLAFLLHDTKRPVFITQRDVRELQLAKGSIRAGIEILLDEFEADYRDLDHIYLAGAFGNYLRKESALNIGLLPPVKREKIVSVGNAAGQGAKLALINRTERDYIKEIARRTRYLELSFRGDFTDKFMSSMQFPRSDS